MNANDLEVILNPLAAAKIKCGAQYKIQDEVVKAYMQKPEYKELVNSVKIDPRILEKSVMNALAKKIIEKWAEDTYENGL